MKKKWIGLLCIGLMASAGLGAATVGAAAAAPTAEDLMMVNGASVRYMVKGEETDYSGIRFAAYVSQDYLAKNPDNEIGMLIIPTELLNGAELTASVADVSIAKAEFIVSLEETDALYKAGYDCFKTVLYNIPEQHYGKQLSARAYVKEGETCTPIGETQVRSMAQVAWGAYQDPKNSAKKGELNTYLAGAEITAPETFALDKGDEQALGATVNYVGVTPKYESENTDVATVDADGKIKAVGAGETTITTTVGEKVKETTVTVSVAPPVAESDPEYTFWSFEDGNCLPDGAYYHTSGNNTSEGQINIAANGDENRTKSLKMSYYWDWIGFKGAQTKLPTGAITKAITVRIKAANEGLTLPKTNFFYFDGVREYPTYTQTSISTDWQEITLTFTKDITSITGFQVDGNCLSGNAIYIDWIALKDPTFAAVEHDPETTFWSFEDDKFPPNGASYYTTSNSDSSNMSIVTNEESGTKSLRILSYHNWSGFNRATTAAVPTTATKTIVIKVKGTATMSLSVGSFYFDGIGYVTNSSTGTNVAITTEWQEITLTFDRNIEKITGFQIDGAQISANNAISIDWFAFGA